MDLPTRLPVCVPTSQPLHLSVYLLPTSLPVLLPTHLFVGLPLFLYLSVCLNACLQISLHTCLSVCLPFYLSVCLYACRSIVGSIHRFLTDVRICGCCFSSVCLSIHEPCIYESIYAFICFYIAFFSVYYPGPFFYQSLRKIIFTTCSVNRPSLISVLCISKVCIHSVIYEKPTHLHKVYV